MPRFLLWTYRLIAWLKRQPHEDERLYRCFLIATYGKLD
jgi:hypothetical protein